MQPVEKIYNLSTIGYDQIIAELDAVAKKFLEIKKAKLDAQKAAADVAKSQGEETQAYKDAVKAVNDLKVKEMELRAEKLRLTNEAKAAQIVRQEETNKQKQSISGNTAEVNSLKAVRAARAELNAAIIGTRVGAPVEFRGLILPYQQANDTLKKLTEQSNAYSRQFQKDGTLVGEYTTGIIKAFKDMGIDDLVSGQVTRANGQLARLNNEFEALKRELQSVKAAGAGSFDNIERELAAVRLTGVNGFDAIEQKVLELGNVGTFSLDKLDQVLQEIKATGSTAFAGIERGLNEIRNNAAGAFNNLEKELIDNRKAALALEQQIGSLNTGLRGAGDIGNQITKGISNGFKEMRGQLAQFILGYVGFQAALQGITTAFNNTIEIEGLNAAMKNISGTTEELAKNKQFLAETGERLGLETIAETQAFKNFYAAATQAGIGSDSVRNIFEAAAQASATLGNSQEQTNGILLAFGQIASKGKVQAEELTGQIGERLPGALAIAARAMGVTQQELFKMMQNGQLLANEFLPKFAAELTKTFGGENQGKIETLSAKVNRLKNIFTEAIQSNNAGISALISGVIFVLTGLLNILPFVTAALGLYAAMWVAANAQMIIARAAIIGNTVAFLAKRAVINTVNLAIAAYNIVIGTANAVTNFFTASLTGATTATTILRGALTLLTGPIGVVIGVIGLLVVSFKAFGNAASQAGEALNKMQERQRAQREVSNAAAGAIAKEQFELDKLYKNATAAGSSQDTLREAKKKLIDQYPEYFKGLTAENITNKQLKDGYDALSKSIIQRAEATAQARLAAEAEEEVVKVIAVRRKVDNEIASGQTLTTTFGSQRFRVLKNLTEEEINILQTAGGNMVKATRNVFGQLTGEVLLFEQNEKKVQAALDRLKGKKGAIADAFAIPPPKNDDNKKPVVLRTLEFLQAELKRVSDDFSKTVKGSAEYKSLKVQKESLEKEIREFNGDTKTKTTGTSKLTAQMRDDFSLIESNLRRELALQETKVIELKKSNKFTFEEEVKNASATQEINIRYITQKIDKLERLKNLNAAEKATLETFRKDRADIELKTINDIREIHNREFQERQTVLRNQLDAEIAAIKQADALVQNDPSKTATDRAQSKLKSDQAILDLYVNYNREVDNLEKQLIQQTTRNSREIVKAQQQASSDVITDRRNVAVARIEDIETEGEREVTYQNTKYQKLRNSVLENETLTQRQRTLLLDRLAKAENVTILTAELKTLEKEEAVKKDMLLRNQISEDEYNKAHLATVKKAGELEQALREQQQSRLEELLNRRAQTFEDLAAREAQRGAISLFKNLDEDEQEGAAALVGEAVSQSFDLASQAMHNYYDAEQERIKNSLDLNLERLGLEKEQAKARATSQAEMDNIDRQYAAKKKDAQKKAGEEIKKAKRAELRIALVTEIANIAVAAAAYPFPFSVAIFGALSGLALGRYALGVGQVNAQQFEQGGQVPKRGGRFGGKPHSQGGTKFVFQDNHYEAEVNELAVIRTKNAPARNKIFQIAGTFDQIASQLNVLGGGVEFAKGAKLKRFATGGMIGGSLQAPVFTQASNNNTLINNNSGITEEQLNRILAKVDETTAATNSRIDRLQVHVNARDITNTQNKIAKNAQVGTL